MEPAKTTGQMTAGLMVIGLLHAHDNSPALQTRTALQHVLTNLVTGHITWQNSDRIPQAHAGAVLTERLNTRTAAALHGQVQRCVAFGILGRSY
jgi:hypothetical protein